MKFYSQADEMRDYCIFYLIIFLIVWTLNETDANRRRNEKNQQTFVVRYKNGDQTIPVTVVLDDKKQTEYVINMSPRTPDKSVTLYDFKQRTIAYKDLTNRECFLGRLTDETLNHEINALSEVQSPIESNPKVLSLVPHKSALTPTEIRNIAGQKTAVFCRKMNTWLIMPKGNHNILKREVEEVEERSYSHHGFHTVKYAHHGHEIRRRYRKPSATSLQSAQEEERTSEEQSTNHGLENRNSSSNNISADHLHFKNLFDSQEEQNHHNSLFLPETTFKQGNHLKIRNENLDLDYLDKSKIPPEADFNSLTHQNSGKLYLNSPNYGNKELLTKYEEELNNLNRKTFVDSNNKKYSQSSEWDPLLHPSNFHNLELANNDRNINDGILNIHEYRPSNIETEEDSSPTTLNISANTLEEPTENPDVSINVLEIPKISKKFENIDRAQGLHETFVQPNEDVHSIFEGFHKLNGNLASSSSHDTYSHISKDTMRSHQGTGNAVDSSIKMFDTDRISLDNLYGQHTAQVITSTPIAEEKDFTSSPLGFGDNLNLNVIGYSGSLNKNLNPHEHKSEVLSENNFFSSNFPINNKLINTNNNYSQITSENRENINSSRDLRFSNHNLLTNYNVDRYSNGTHQSSPKFAVNQPTFPLTNQVHLHDILRNYKPDEIVIDIGKIPTEKPPDSTSGFRGRDTSFAKTYDQRPSLNMTRPFHSSNKPISNVNSSSTALNDSRRVPPNRSNLSRRRHFPSLSSNRYPTSLPSNNFLQMNPSPKQISPPFLGHLPKLGALPPGVSLHPRHPQAPYADMVRTNMLHTLPQRTISRPIKPHRQRHHRRKDHDSSTCCKSNSRLSACCSWHLRRGIQINSSCCASYKHRENLEQRRLNPTALPRRFKYRPTALSIKDTLPVLRRRDNFPFVQRKNEDDKRDRCQKEKMCRTLYESTRKVMVCRNINVEGC